MLKPQITEKTRNEAEKHNSYTFLTYARVTKSEARNEVEKTFGVKVVDIHTLFARGKEKRYGKKRQKIQKQDMKKIIVKLSPKDRINIFGTEEKGKKKKKKTT